MFEIVAGLFPLQQLQLRGHYFGSKGKRTRGAHETGRVERDFEEVTAGPWMLQTSE